MVLDLDHFKQVNDTHGHDVGDEVLKAVANCLKDMTRYHDVVARLGGEEFAVVAPNMDGEVLDKFAERIRRRSSATVVAVRQFRLKITASVGWRSGTARKLRKSSIAAPTASYQAKKPRTKPGCA